MSAHIVEISPNFDGEIVEFADKLLNRCVLVAVQHWPEDNLAHATPKGLHIMLPPHGGQCRVVMSELHTWVFHTEVRKSVR